MANKKKNTHCLHCGKKLTGNQLKFCSTKCRSEAEYLKKRKKIIKERITKSRAFNLQKANEFEDVISNLEFTSGLPSGLCAQFNPLGGE